MKKVDGEDKFPIPERKPGRPREADMSFNEERSLSRAASSELSWEPSEMQERVKSRFYRNLEDVAHVYDLPAILKSPELLTRISGSQRISGWMQDPSFRSWFLDENSFQDDAKALRGKALKTIGKILESDLAMDGDKLKASRMILELTASFPEKKSEQKFLDEKINKMSGDEARAEILRLKEQLGEDVIDVEKK